jgi:nucleotide-binding universal stress UspA family protein
MATNGEAGIGRWAFGGVTDRVLRDGKTPLLLAHTGQK